MNEAKQMRPRQIKLFTTRFMALLLAALLAAPIAAQQTVDPLTVAVDTSDADRFAAVFARTQERPTATDLQREYLDKGSDALRIFTPGRIENAKALADHVASHRDQYRTAIERCLPVAKMASAELRAIYLGLRGLYPDRPLPRIHVVFGRGNSGGTAGPEAQVLGLEVLCELDPDAAALRQRLRMMFAHETVHTWQLPMPADANNLLLRGVLLEGAADYVASLVLGMPPSPEREAWAQARESELWQQFKADIAITRNLTNADYEKNPAAQAAVRRWIGNYGAAPAGWPFELGYWIGMRIWQRHVSAAKNKRAATDEVLTWSDPEAILASGTLKP